MGAAATLSACAPAKSGSNESKDKSKNKDIMDAVNDGLNALSVVNYAKVRCTSGIEETDTLFVVDSEGNQVEFANITTLTRQSIEMSNEGKFQSCQYTDDKKCPGAVIEDLTWKDFDELSSLGEGKETLSADKAYMVCTEKHGVIYIIEPGQMINESAEQYVMLNKYINEDTFKAVNSRWDINKLKENYGDDVFIRLREGMLRAGIVGEKSICAFIATIGTECGYGLYKTENYVEKNKQNYNYEKSVRGVGLIQVSVGRQKEFLKYMLDYEKDPEKIKNINDLIEGFDYNPKYYNKNEVDEKDCATFLGENYALDISIWYWGSSEWSYYPDVNNVSESEPMSPNEYVEYFAKENEDNLKNVFLASQMHVNANGGWAQNRKQKIAEESDPDKYKILIENPEKDAEESKNNAEKSDTSKDEDFIEVSKEDAVSADHEEDNEIYYISFDDENGEDQFDEISRHWGQRYHDWLKLREMMGN